ncbi:PGG domain-containing protein [Heracleum sosnowskyi]|uniref:PGG domain-containing protein n=1 Tax=Heracleum sosnowskyi TaxID=360622 RepID=A0AAD8GXB3_9APIA|nr:PGG domain-containing protein [Heracleum sosnowskyi]
MNIEVMEKKLYSACLKGDVETMKAMMEEDDLILARVSISSCFNQTPLHVVSMLGHFEFAKALLSYKPDLASRLDSQGRSPLHLASANGYANIVKLLLEHDQEIMCRVLDEDGRTPLHLAIMNGYHESVRELTKVQPELYDQETTMLHLCVMYNRLNVLILILESNVSDLSNIKDRAGNSILHSATALRRIQIIKYLVMSSQQVDVDAVNENGLTALDIIEQMPKDVKTIEIKELLISSAGTLRVKETKDAETTSLLIPGVGGVANHIIESETATDSNSKLVKMWWEKVKRFTIFQEKREKSDKTLLVAASVIAAMAYQAAISPPGGVAEVDATEILAPSPLDKIYELGPAFSLLAYFYPGLSNEFWICNTISFMASLSVIFLYVSGATLKRRLFIWLIRAAMWITLTSMIGAYSCAVAATNASDYTNNTTALVVTSGLAIWLGLMILSIVILIYRFICYLVRTNKKKRETRKKIRSDDSVSFLTPSTNIV